MNAVRRFDQITAEDLDAVGGKGLSLGLMAGAGLPVPAGFCLTSEAYRAAAAAGDGAVSVSPQLQSELLAAYHQLGGAVVAVRSSATLEDGATTSFAGQQETILGVQGDAALVEAVGRCWASLDTERAKAYRQKQQVDDARMAMAVVVQSLVPAEVAGVLFTTDPLDPEGRQMLVEAAWGLGEAVVSGRVTPDRYHLDRASGAVIDRHISNKPLEWTADGPRDVPQERRDQPCLDDEQLAALARLGQQVEEFYGQPRDLEWAWAEGRFWLLQARPITTAGAFERQQVRREEMAILAARSDPRGTVWARYNLAEVLPAPTPMTWAFVGRLMSGRGGLGMMYRDLGYDPDPDLDEAGFIDLVCGRPYVNLSRECRMSFRDFPYGYDFAALKADPQRAMYPKPTVDAGRAGLRFWLRLPLTMWQMLQAQSRVRRELATTADMLRQDVFPRFVAAIAEETAVDLAGLSTDALILRLEAWRARILDDFARVSLRPSVFAALALGSLEQALATRLGSERAAVEVRTLVSGVRPDPEADLPRALGELAQGTLDRESFLRRFGHRGSQEMELSQPRWSEAPDTLPAAGSTHLVDHAPGQPPAERFERLAAESGIAGAQRQRGLTELAHAETYLALRETSKHYLMLGYRRLRAMLVELDRRFSLAGGVFYLTPDELPRLAAGENLGATIASRRTRRQLALSLEAPPVLFSDDLDAIGRPLPLGDATQWQGTPVSAGVVEGPALVLEEPSVAALPPPGYILVCPSTDPAWVPLFLSAGGLVMETGGVLSHGAIVAREFGLPAVAGISQVHRRLQSGQRLRVDGNTGRVALFP